MKKSQRGAAVAVVVIGLIVLAAASILLISQLLEERAARQRLEQETAELRQEIMNLKARPTRVLLKRTRSSRGVSKVSLSRSERSP